MSIISQSSVSGQLRAVLAGLAGVCFVGALFPESDSIPFQDFLQHSRSPQEATQATRWLFLIGSCLSAVMFAAWTKISHIIAFTRQSIMGLSSKAFWSLAFGVAVALRLPFVFLSPYSALRTDALWYHTTALSIASGHGLQFDGVPTAYRPPGYSALLAATYQLISPNPALAWILGTAATTVILLTTYHLAKYLYGEVIARTATLVISFYPALILYTGQPMSDLVFTAGLMLVWYVVTLHPPYRYIQTIGVGIALALLTLTRSIAIGLFMIVPLLWFLKQPDVRKLIPHFILLTAVFAACLTPWLLRNYKIFGTPTLGTNMGLVLYIGNHADASGGFEIPIPASMREPDMLLNDAPLDEAQIDRIYFQSAIEFLVAHPTDALLILPKKIIQLFLLEVGAAQSLFQDWPSRLKYAFYAITQIFYMPILALFSLRILNLMDPITRPRGIQWIGLISIGYFTLMAMLFFGQDRFRLPFLPWMIIESSIVFAWLANRPELDQRS